MNNRPSDSYPSLEDKAFLVLLVAVSVAFGWVLQPYYSALFWAAALAILFAPLQSRVLLAMPGRRNTAALTCLMCIVALVLLPLIWITGMLVKEGAQVYQKLQSGEINFSVYLQKIYAALPDTVTSLLDRFGLGSSGLLQERLTAALTSGSQFFASQAVGIGQDAFNLVVGFFIMLYVLFFFLRDGAGLVDRIRRVIPLKEDVKQDLGRQFATVITATVKGNIAVAMVQGALGGLIFWALDINAPVLWGVVMAFLSLLPAVGAAVVWLPVAVYLLIVGQVISGLVLIAFGVLVIGLVDNVLRPILVGKDTKMPDYVVLLSTLGGISLFGLDGFVIGPVIAAMFMAAWGLLAGSRKASP
ncbi:MAG: AI-2E family transporter [Comamonadaceae bacterium]|jgi:predicted PurR-regulated permease PerM|nr:AI-2E family transporter [Comamonadaceae bacterium]